MFLKSARSQLFRPGPRPNVLGVLPSARMRFTSARVLGAGPPTPGAEKAAVLKYCSTVRWSLGRLGSPLITARHPSPPPVISRLLSRLPVPRTPPVALVVEALSESGDPLVNLVIPDICQPS